ncbi:MAG: hypothetical protein K0V04_46500 [Deltaproteobacteria bacterium]|nr:hypothetical protein [Deltaproteobacteria bacterium]
MNDDERLEALGERARQQWSEQTAAVRPESVEGWTPLRESEREDIIGAALAALEQHNATPSDDAPRWVPDATDPGPGPADVAEPTPAANDGPGRWRWAAVGVVVAVAAVMVLWLGSMPRVSALPGYAEAEFEAGTAAVRGDAPQVAIARLPPSATIRWVLRPATAVEGGVGVRILAQGPATHCMTLPSGVRIADSGAVELYGEVETMLPLSPGVWTLTAIVGRAQVLDGLDNACAWHAEGSPPPPGLAVAATRTVELVPGT